MTPVDATPVDATAEAAEQLADDVTALATDWPYLTDAQRSGRRDALQRRADVIEPPTAEGRLILAATVRRLFGMAALRRYLPAGDVSPHRPRWLTWAEADALRSALRGGDARRGRPYEVDDARTYDAALRTLQGLGLLGGHNEPTPRSHEALRGYEAIFTAVYGHAPVPSDDLDGDFV
jgi:hypothetical protein